ncbi:MULTISPECIES: hypothetical protein [Streptomyces]|uniref:hypothetical protein n=1 Tax=Streptomyces TaxID=1883 RepID=UPI002FDBA601
MTCETGNALTNFVVGFFSFLSDPIGTIIGLIAKFILAAAIAVFATPVPTMTGTTTAKEISDQTQWLVFYLAVGSLLFACARMAVERRATAGTTALKGILRVILVSGGATAIVMAAASVADAYSAHLYGLGVQNVLKEAGSCQWSQGIESFLLLILAFLLLIGGIIQTILMYIRLGVMILLLGTLPLAAAASMTDWGGGWWRKHIGWMIAWLLYKPAAGLVMYAGSALFTSDEAQPGGVNERIAGIGVLLLSAVALPALLKLVVPATAALGGASAYSGAMQSAGGGLATGARSLGGSTGQAGPSGGSRSSGGSGPSGASGSSGGSGLSGAGGVNGAAGVRGGGGRPGPGGANGESAGAGTPSRGRAVAASGAAGAAVTAAVNTARVLGRAASGALDGADGDQGHNPSHHR